MVEKVRRNFVDIIFEIAEEEVEVVVGEREEMMLRKMNEGNDVRDG